MNKSIPGYSEFDKESAELEYLLDTPDEAGCLQKYLAYLDKYCAKDYFFLLRNGEAHLLPREPSHIYLLPDILGWETRRLLLCQYRNPTAVSLLVWDFLKNDKAVINCFGAVKESPVAGMEENHVGDLEKRALRIKPNYDDAAETIQITLEFPHGKVVINADKDDGIRHVGWKNRGRGGESATQRTRYERSSWGAMPEIVGVEWHDDANWRDDALHEVATKNRINLSNFSDPLGQVLGADASGRQPEQHIYLATNQARVAQVTAQGGAPVYSERLGGMVHDVLVTPDPDNTERDVVLATTYDGAAYLLQDQDGKFCIRNVQAHSAPLVRLIGGGGQNLLALDKHYNLLPLRLTGTNRVRDLREKAARTLHQRVKNQMLTDDDTARLLLEAALLTLGTGDFPLTELRALADRLKRDYRDLDANAIRARGRLHFKLLKRLYAWLRQTTSSRAAGDAVQWRALLGLLELPQDAPDRLWLYAMRLHNRLTPWQELNLPKEKGELGAFLEATRNAVGKMRKAMLPVIHNVRPLSIKGSTRLAGQVHHVRRLGEADTDGALHVILWEHPSRVRVLRIPEDTTQVWQRVYALDAQPGKCPWQGLPSAIAADQELDRVFSPPGKPMPHVLIGTNRGELVLFRWEKRELVLLRMWEVDMEIACLNLVAPGAGHRYLLLGGTNAEQHPALWRLFLDNPERQPQELWDGEGKGTIRMMQLHKDDLWAIERQHGRLWHWPTIGDKLRRPREVSFTPEHQWLEQGDKLHALDLAAGRKKHLLCGGHNGMAYALDGDNGRLAWLAGCGNSLRQAAFLDGKDGGTWLVGGDSPDTLWLDSQGRLAGVVEGLGPVTAICKLDEHKLLVGGLDGRLTLLSDTAPDRITPPPAPEHGALGDYPLRCQDPCPRTLAAALNGLEAQDDETITAQALLGFARDCLPEVESGSDLAKALEKHLQDEPPARVAWLLRMSPENARLAEPWLELMASLWAGIGKRPPDEPLCHIVNASLALLERDASERVLLQTLLDCLWDDKACAPSLGKKAARVTLMRLAQAQRLWQQADNPAPAVRLANWCVNLQQVWRCESEAIFSRRLLLILDQNLPWLGKDEDGWLAWLHSLANHGTHAAPLPFGHLEAPQLRPLEANVLQALLDLWPDDFAWQTWLNDLQVLLSTVADAMRAYPPFAWHERDALRSLNAHVHNAPFRLDSHPLPALWKPRLVAAWSTAVQKRQDDIEAVVMDSPATYIDMKVVDRWLGDGRVELRLELFNRAHTGLTLKAAAWQGADVALNGAPPNLSANREPVKLPLTIRPAQSDHLDGELRLSFRDGEGRLLERIQKLDCRRGITGYTSAPEMAATWQRLDNLIQSWVREQTSFLWLDGHALSREEHQGLRTHVRIKFGLAMENIATLDAASAGSQPIFSPDLALGANASRLLEEVHALLHDRRHSGLSWSALSLWRWARPEEWPQALEMACYDKLLPRSEGESLLLRLLGDVALVANIKQALVSLPTTALGAWCYGDPLYAGLPTENIPESYYRVRG